MPNIVPTPMEMFEDLCEDHNDVYLSSEKKITSKDGLLTAETKYVDLWEESVNHFEQLKQTYIDRFRLEGYMGFVPNDGWNNREEYYFNPVFPHYFDSPNIGDYVIIGWYDDEPKNKVEIIDIEKTMTGLTHYHYKIIGLYND